jgi:hypothetical protein
MQYLSQGAATVAGAAVLFAAAAVHAQPYNHEQCYKIKDPVKLEAFADMDVPQYAIETGCKIGKAQYFCGPAEKTVTSAIDKATGIPIAPLPIYGGPDSTFDRVCYKMKCPEPVSPPDTIVTDQFGTRTLTKYKTKMICTPAVKGAAFCGNGVIDPGEDCDAPALGACPGTCESDCKCTCSTACCYVEQPPLPPAKPMPDAECFQYTGPPAQVSLFMTGCTLGGGVGSPGSLAAPFLVNSSAPVICSLGPPSPVFGVPCMPGPPGVGNIHIMPTDSTCP